MDGNAAAQRPPMLVLQISEKPLSSLGENGHQGGPIILWYAHMLFPGL